MRHDQELLISEEEGDEPGKPSSLQGSLDDGKLMNKYIICINYILPTVCWY